MMTSHHCSRELTPARGKFHQMMTRIAFANFAALLMSANAAAQQEQQQQPQQECSAVIMTNTGVRLIELVPG
jgi:hypothetical protein